MQSVTGSGRVVAGRYELLDPVGHGAMGTVWRARDLHLDREVAVKEVRVSGPMTYQDRNVLRERSLREARVAARLSHPGVVTVHHVIEAEGTPWIIMELVPSRSLAQVLAEDGPLPPARAAMMGMALLEALGSAHAAGVVHRDVKPGNILVTPEGRAVLTDFGIATLHGDPGLTQAGMVMGTPGFCAPERIRGEPASPASDLWSLGATLYAAVEGRGPFEGQGSAMAVLANIVHGDPPPAKSAGPLGPVITALMRRDPAARPDATNASRLLAAACAGYDGVAPSGAQSVSGAQAGSEARSASGVQSASGARGGSGVSAVSGAGAGAGAVGGPLAGADSVGAETVAPGATGLGTTLAFPASPPQGIAAFAGQPPAAPELPGPVTAAEPAPAAPVNPGPHGTEFAATVAAQPSPGMTAATAPVAAGPGGVPGAGWAPVAGGIPGPSGMPGRGGMPGPGPMLGGQRRRPGRHRRALLFGGGGTAVILAALMVTLGHAHAARLQEIRRTAASSPITASGPLPAGYHWYTAQPSSSPRRAGFSIAVPNGWRTRQRGDTTLMRNPLRGSACRGSPRGSAVGGPLGGALGASPGGPERGDLTACHAR
jgi:tRNA A-37 threonylcarbamoyl transferase component Bud32